MEKKEKNKEKFEIQNEKYQYPYHYLPYLEKNRIIRYRALSWGHVYLCYLNHIKELIEELNPNSILDIGCGDGRFLGMLDNDKFEDINGVDLSKKAIRFARSFNPDIEFKNCDAEDLVGTYEVVTAIEVLEHIPNDDTDRFLRVVDERTEKRGTAIISVPTKNILKNPKHYRHYDENLLKKELRSAEVQLEIKKIDYVYRSNFLINAFKFLTENRFWFFEPKFLNKWIWKYVYNNLRFADEEDGEHMVVVLRKK